MLSNPKEEKLDPRVKRTRSLILRSFSELLAEKGFESISVQDVTDKAEINRATFYKHFVDKYELNGTQLVCFELIDHVVESFELLPVFSLADIFHW